MEPTSLIAGINSLVTMVRNWSDFRDAHVVAAVKADLTEKLLQTQLGLSEVLASVIEKDSRIHHLTDRVRELEAKQAERARYELREIFPRTQVFAYALKGAPEADQVGLEPSHFACQLCMDRDGIRSVLGNWSDGRSRWAYFCANCGWRCADGMVNRTPLR